jgi:hypothetical protein
VTQHVFPFVFGFGCLAAVVLAVVGTANRITFAAAGAAGDVCRVDNDKPAHWDGNPPPIAFPSNELCMSTGVELREGQRYRVEIELPDAAGGNGPWMDKTIPVETPEGFSSGRHPLLLASLPFRRVLTARWFVPIVRVGHQLAEYHPIDQLEETLDPVGVPTGTSGSPSDRQSRARKVKGFVEFTPTFTGPMFLFVNDAVLPGSWRTFYDNNLGTATVTVRAIEPDPVRTAAH